MSRIGEFHCLGAGVGSYYKPLPGYQLLGMGATGVGSYYKPLPGYQLLGLGDDAQPTTPVTPGLVAAWALITLTAVGIFALVVTGQVKNIKAGHVSHRAFQDRDERDFDQGWSSLGQEKGFRSCSAPTTTSEDPRSTSTSTRRSRFCRRGRT